MRQLTTSDKIAMRKPITDNRMMMRFRDGIYPLLMLLCGSKVKYEVRCLNSPPKAKDGPVIFAANHSAFPDTPLALKATGKQSYVLTGVQRLAPEDMLFFGLIGSIWVDRTDREDMKNAKEALTAYLKSGRSVLWFPEGTWNLTENLMMLPMKWGIVETARESGAQIVPLALDYDREKLVCTVKFGEAFLPSGDKAQEIRKLRDGMAALRWEIWEQRGVFRRKELDIETCRKELFQPVLDYPPLEWEKEQKAIFWPYDSPEEVFAFRERLRNLRV